MNTVGYIVYLSRRRPGSYPPAVYGKVPAQIVKPVCSWGPWREVETLLPAEVSNHAAPEFPRAKFRLNIGATRKHVWRWENEFAHEDRVMICSDHAKAGGRSILFDGFIADVDWTFDRDESMTVTAVSPAARLALDANYIVHGRKMLDKAGTVRWYSGLSCHFNAGGRPNMHPIRQTDLGASLPGHSGSGSYQWSKGVPVFTYDDDPAAVWWTAVDIFNYLQWRFNFAQSWVSNYIFSIADFVHAKNYPVEVSIEGLNLWDALGAVADRAGYDVSENTGNDGEGKPTHGISILRRHTGAIRVVTHQPPNNDGTFPVLDTDDTNLFSASVAETTIPAIARPFIIGGVALFEVTVELGKAWPTALAIPSGEQADPQASPRRNATYYSRYCVGGSSFLSYAAAGRLWDANTDGRYSAAPYSLSVPDMAALADCDAGTWPPMPYRPAPCITELGATTRSSSRQSFVEVSFNAGSTWQPLTGCRVLPDRLAIMITQANLAQIQASGGNNPYQDNLFYKLVNDAANVKVRLTCSVVSPLRQYYCPARRTTAGTVFDQGRFFAQGQAGQVRLVASSSVFYGQSYSTDEVTAEEATGDLRRIAQQVQNAAEDRFVEASMPIEWVDPPVRIGDVIEQVKGINYNLKVNCGPRKISPRVIGYTHLLEPSNYSTQIILDTDRKAGAT